VQEYAYQALMASGNVAAGRMPAADEEELEATLRTMGHYLIRAEPVEAEPPIRTRTDARISRGELLAFVEYLWASTEAGIPILTTLEDAELRMESKRLRAITREVRSAVRDEGKSLSEAMAEHPKAFPVLFIGTVAAGETSGRLDYSLSQLVSFLEWQQEVTTSIRQATFYPALLLAGMLGLVVLLLSFVYPRLLPIFTSFDIELPLPTRVLMGASASFMENWQILLVGLVGSVLLVRMLALTAGGKYLLDSLKLKIPLFGKLLASIEMARFVTYMSLFYRTGIDLLQGLRLLEDITGNAAVARGVARAREAVAAGDSLADAFSLTHQFPPIVIRVLALGESTGKLDEALDRAKAYYDREVPAAVNRMLTALQPLLIIVMGGLLLVIMMSIFLPILSIYNNLGV
jgi:type IV pilus assembly protein PilC